MPRKAPPGPRPPWLEPDVTHVHRLHRDARTLLERLPSPDQPRMQPIVDLMRAMAEAEAGPEGKRGIRDYVIADLKQTLRANDLTGPIAEVGGSRNGLAAHLPEHDFTFLSLHPTDDHASIVADVSKGLGAPMRGIPLEAIPEQERLAVRGW